MGGGAGAAGDRSSTPRRILLTCEHAGTEVPPRFAGWLRGPQAEAALVSHAGSDLGAFEVATTLAARLGAPLIAHLVTRLLVDTNRAEHNPRVFSSFTRSAPTAVKAALFEEIHAPHRRKVRAAVSDLGPVLHLAVHSFTPVWHGRSRAMDIGLLYDPRRTGERVLGTRWQAELRQRDPSLVVRRNAPYRGRTDGLPTWLRKLYAETAYLGFEIEVNQACLEEAGAQEAVAHTLADSLLAVRREVRT